MPTTPTTRRLKGPTCRENAISPCRPATSTNQVSFTEVWLQHGNLLLPECRRPASADGASSPGSLSAERPRSPCGPCRAQKAAQTCSRRQSLWLQKKPFERTQPFPAGLPLSLVAAASSVTHQQDHFLRSHVFIGGGGQRSHGALHEGRRPAAFWSVLQVVVVQVCQKAPWKTTHTRKR